MITICTGYETERRPWEPKGVCFWCGGILPPRRRRYYCDAHQDEYYRHFWWISAQPWCMERYNHTCADCGKRAEEAHHIIPLPEGATRTVHPLNRPENLVALCCKCHGKRHTKPKLPKEQLPLFEIELLLVE